MRKWWSMLPEYARPIILGSAITIAVGVLAWFLAKGVPAMIQWIYGNVLMRLGKAKRLISAEGSIETGTFATYVSTDDLIKRSGVWAWLARRAMRWETKKKMGFVESSVALLSWLVVQFAEQDNTLRATLSEDMTL